MVKEIVMMDYASVVCVLCLIIFILTNHYINKRIRMLFLVACVLSLCLVFVDSVEYWTASFSTMSPLRIWMSAIGYSLRPAIIFLVIMLILRNKKTKELIWLVLPLILNTLIAFSALFSDVAYSYTADNQFVRGPIGYFAFVTTAFYEILLIACTINIYKSVHISETIISVVVVVIFIISTVLESVWKYDGVINVSGAVALTFYYLYLNTQQFKRDTLTNVLNRRCFFLDGEKNESNLSALMSIDLNDLKKWNDEYGHVKGDEALCTMVDCIEKSIPSNCYLYRVGGDEFMVLCFNQKKLIVEQFLKKIKENMAGTPFSCAIGVAYKDVNNDFNKMCLKADKAMYEDKKIMKRDKVV